MCSFQSISGSQILIPAIISLGNGGVGRCTWQVGATALARPRCGRESAPRVPTEGQYVSSPVKSGVGTIRDAFFFHNILIIAAKIVNDRGERGDTGGFDDPRYAGMACSASPILP
jgi:hypothetical protein